MKMRTMFALCALAAFGSAEARTASAADAGKDKKKAFSELMIALLPPVTKPTGAGTISAASVKTATPAAKSTVTAARATGTVKAQDASLLNPRAVRLFDARLTAFIRRFPNRVPPATSFLPGRTIAFRQEFIFERFTPGATVGGVFFTTAATPFIPGAVNVFNYFPVYSFGI